MEETYNYEKCNARFILSEDGIWGLEVEGCEKILGQKEAKSGPYTWKYLSGRIKKVEKLPEAQPET